MKAIDILVDFDGTCVAHDFPRIGKDIGSVSVLTDLVKAGHRIILFTMRSDSRRGNYLTHAVNWFKDNDIPLYGINVNPTQKRWTTSPKAYGQLLIDDIALGIPLKNDATISNRPFVDWVRVKELLIQNELLK